MLTSFRARHNCEIEAKFMQDRVNFTERNLSEFCQIFSEYARKVASVRDAGDDVAKTFVNYAENEHINNSLSVGLSGFADLVTKISDYEDVRVGMIDKKIVRELARYEEVCKQMRDDVKDIFSARDKESMKRRQFDRIKQRNPTSRQLIVQAETDLVKATAEVAKAVHNLEEKSIKFERQKLHDIKSILLDFITIEIGFHAKSLEILTKCYKNIDSIDEQSDIDAFKQSLKIPEKIPHPSFGASVMRSAQSLTSLGVFTGKSKESEKMSKSEETLDSLKRSITTSEEASSNNNSSEEEVEEEEETEDRSKSLDLSPIVVRGYLP